MGNVVIRKENADDFKATEHMTMRAFWNIHTQGCDEHYLVHILRNSKDYLPEFSRIAELGGRIVGAIFYSRAWVIDGDKKNNIVTFGPLAVEPTMQNKGIGRRLMQETFPLLKAAGYTGICITGEPEYYPKYGFKTCDNFGITDAEGNNFDALMGLELVPGGFQNIKGKFVESDIFGQANDAGAVKEFDKLFPAYPKYQVPSQWLHREKLGKIIDVFRSNFSSLF